MHTAEHDLSPEAEEQIESIVNRMVENDRENEQLRREIECIVDRDAPA